MAVDRLDASQVVAHRGWPVRYPENCLEGFRQAIAHGARWLETDIQVADDGTPWLFHDALLRPLCNAEGSIFQCEGRHAGAADYPHLVQSHACMTQFDPQPLARLDDLTSLLERHPECRCFWELKPQTIHRHGIEFAASSLIPFVRRVRSQITVISLDLQSLTHLRTVLGTSIGGVVTRREEGLRAVLEGLQPDFVLCDHRYWQPHQLRDWRATWRWIAYTINDLTTAEAFLSHGAAMVETDHVAALLPPALLDPNPLGPEGSGP